MTRLVPFVVALILAGAIVVDAVVPAAERAPELATPYVGAGVLVCPFGVEEGARAYVHVANLGETPARLRISVVPGRGDTVTLEQGLGAGRARNVRVHGRVDGRATVVVEHTGGRVAASHSLWFRRTPAPRRLRQIVRPRGAAAAMCTAPGPGAISLSHVGTRDREVRLLVYNPGAADATVSITLHADDRVLRPSGLGNPSPRLIRPRRFRLFRLEDFAFSASEVTAVLHIEGGRVVAEALTVAHSGVSLTEGDPSRDSLLAVSGASGGRSAIGLAAVGDEDTGLGGTLISVGSQGRAARVPPDLAPGSTTQRRTPPRGDGGPVAYMLGTTIGGPIAAGVDWRVERNGSDRAAVGSTTLAHRWVAATGSPEERSTARAVIVNPGAEPVQARVRRLGGEGIEDVVIDPGRLIVVPVGRGRGAFGLDVSADGDITILIETSARGTRGGRSTTYGSGIYGIPVVEHEPVPVALDPRAGVPAPLQRPF